MDQDKEIELIGAAKLAEDIFAGMEGKNTFVCIEVLSQILTGLAALEKIPTETALEAVRAQIERHAAMFKRIHDEHPGVSLYEMMNLLQQDVMEAACEVDPETWCADCMPKKA